MLPFIAVQSFPTAAPPTLIYAARFYDTRPKVRTYSHLYRWRIGQTGKGTPLTTGANDDTNPQVAPDGKTVFFIRTRNNVPPTVCAISLQSGQIRRLFTGAATAELYAFHVSPSGKNLLVEQVVYDHKPDAQNHQQWFVVSSNGSPNKNAPRLLWRGEAGEEADMAWTADDTQVLLVHPPRFHWNDKTFEQKMVRAGSIGVISLAAPNAARLLPTEADDNTLETDLSPDRRFVLDQPYDTTNEKSPFTSASVIRIADGKFIAKWAVAPNERLHWLAANRLVGVDHKSGDDWTPNRFRFYSVERASTAPPTPFVDLQLNTAAVKAALKADYEEMDRLTRAEPLSGDQSGAFLMGTPWHRGNKGVRFRINAQTGQAALWSKSFTPHPSPNDAYFWSQPGTDFAVVGKRPDGTTMTEPVWPLFVASYANPARLIPVVSGAAWANGADWLPVSTPAHQSDPTKAAKDKTN